jgi:diguanylate cyclase (GGDEF)-like protein/PAS domain S-box-containing protein
VVSTNKTGGPATRVLLIDGAAESQDLISGHLAEQDRTRFELEWCRDFKSGAKTMVEGRHDVYLIAQRLGQQSGLDLVRTVRAAGFQPPVVILLDDHRDELELEDAALDVAGVLVKAGAEPLALEQTIRHALARHQAITELVAREQRYELAAHAASDALWDWDLQTQRIFVSHAWHAIIGRQGEEGHIEPASLFELVHADDLLRLRAAIDTHLAGDTARVECEYRMLSGDGSWRWVKMLGYAVFDQKGTAIRLTGWLSDVAERHAAEVSLSHDALHDPLTRLPNRILFIDRLDHATSRARRDPNVPCAVMFIDIDRFELINERLGHSLGDQLLRAVGGRMAGLLRPGDTVARLASDEFAVLLDGVDEDHNARTVANRIQAAVSQPFRVGGHEVFITARIGIALSTAGISAAELLRNADIAMYDARRKGRGRIAVFDETMHGVHRLSRHEELREMVSSDRLAIHYQPIVDLATGNIRGFEALARWPEDSNPMTPLEFIALAEQAGLIGELGLRVLTCSLEALAHWRNAGLITGDALMSVNVSAGQLEDPMFASRVRAAIASSGISPELLRLEITEKTLIKDLDRVEAITQEIRESGIVLHLDDFGTGESSLTLLQRLPIEALKIDRSFISAMNGRGTSDAIVRSMIALGHGLGLRLIAEGIEQPAQLKRLRMLGCEYGQGYVFSRPLTREDAEDMLAGWVAADVAALGDSTEA